MEKFTDKKELLANYFGNDNDAFFVQQLGYHDYNQIPPKKLPFIQKMYTLHFIISGSGTLNIYGKRYHLKQYDMFLIPPSVQMSYYPDEDTPWTYVWIAFSGKDAASHCGNIQISPNTPLVSCSQPHQAYNAIVDVFRRLDMGAEVRYYLALSFFYRMLDTCLAKASYDTSDIVSQAVSYIRCHFHNPDLRVETICRDLNVSYEQLSKKFKQAKGISIRLFLIQTRMNEAKLLLRTTKLTVGEIAFSVGYIDNIHFMKFFKKYTGTTATEYRNNKMA